MISQRTILVAAIVVGVIGITSWLDISLESTVSLESRDILTDPISLTDRVTELFGRGVQNPERGVLISDRYFVSGDFPAEDLERIIKNIESGESPGTEFSATIDRSGTPTSPSHGTTQPTPTQNAIDGELRTSKLNLSNEELAMSLLFDDANPDEEALPEKPNPISGGWYVSKGQICKNFGPPEDPDPRCVDGAPKGASEGARCYIKRDGSVHCAASPAFSISPIADPSAVSNELLPVCGYNQKRSEQTGVGEPYLDGSLEEIGLCLDITHSAWTSCGPGPTPVGLEEEFQPGRDVDLLAPPAITAGGCNLPCSCVALPSGNCRDNKWCVGPPGCPCVGGCPGLACNVCCAGSAYLWDATSGWCACANDVPIGPSGISTPSHEQ